MLARIAPGRCARPRRFAAPPLATLLAALLLAHPATAAEDFASSGTWTIESWTNRDRTQFSLSLRWSQGSEHWGSRSMPLERVAGLKLEQITADPSVVHFELHRDAGTVVCDGHVGRGQGAGLYTLELDPTYGDELAKRHIGRPTREQQVRLALADVSFAFLDELKDQHYPTPSLELLVKLADHGVDRHYLDGMGALGIRFDSFDELLRARDHGVDPDFVKGMREAGFDRLTFEELLASRDHGVDPRYIQGMRDAGFTGLTLEELRKSRDHGVDPRFMRGMAEAGYEHLSLDDRGGLD